MSQHKDLTGADLHEPKGCASATSGQVYVANGAGSGAWTDPLAGVNNLNVFQLQADLSDISSTSSAYIRVSDDCTLTNLYCVMDAAITGADSTISLYRDGVLLGQSLLVPIAGSGEGVKLSLALSPTYAFTSGQVLKLLSNGASTDTARLFVTAKFTAS